MRWSEQTVEADQDGRLPGLGDTIVRTYSAPDSVDIRFHEIHAKSALNRVPAMSRVPFEWTINPYRGCTHSCSYCFARPTHEYLDMDAGRDFEREIIVKVNVPEVLRAELARPSWKGDHVALGTNTDPYQWVEKRYGLMRGIWEAMRDFSNPCSILTKSPLVLRDADLLEEIAQRTHVHACLSIPTVDERAWRDTEPHTPHPRARLKGVKELNERGIPTGVLVAPIMPGINDSPEQIQATIDACNEAGAVSIGGQALFLAGSTKQVFLEALQEKRPELMPLYKRLYGNRAHMSKTDKAKVEEPLARHRRMGAARFSRPTAAEAAVNIRRAPRITLPEAPAPVQESLF